MKTSPKIVIVGGVAGGASAAARARRVDENAEIHIFERGPYISFANCGLPYFIGGEIDRRDKLIVMTPETMWHRSRVHAHVNHEVLAIDRVAKTIAVKEQDGTTRDVAYDKLILSQGARPIVPAIPGVDQSNVFTLRDIPDMDRIVAFINEHRPRRAVVVGGGFIGLEMAEAFLHRGMTVTVVEKFPHILPLLDSDMAAHLQRQIERPGFQIVCGAEAKRFATDAVELSDGRRVEADLILLSIGVRAEVELARSAGLEIGATGGIKTNEWLQSSDPSIWAVGDAAEVTHVVSGGRARIALAGPANRQGRIAGTNAAGGQMTYAGAMGTSIVRVLNVSAGFVGLNSAQAANAGFDFTTSMTRDDSHAHYFPGAKTIVTKLIFETKSGRILGAQIIGEDGVDKRIDVVATAIAAKMTVFDLENLDLAYSPPFNSANDPINIAGFVASHAVRGDIATVAPETWKPNGELLLDVRDPDELKTFGKLKGAVNIPLQQLRDRLAELPRNRHIVIYCQKGQRGYLGACALSGNGFNDVVNLRGGFLQAELNGCGVEH